MSRPHPPSPVPSAAPAKRQRPVHIRDFTCLLCDVRCNDSTSLARHISSAQHRHHLLTAPAAGTTPAAAAPPPAPAVYIDRSTAVEQLFSVVQTMYPQTALVSRVVRHMFYTRTRRVAKTVVSESVRAAKTIDEYSALLLNAPMLEPLVQAARDRLAVADQPPITLTDDEREALQTDCLYRRFLCSEIGHHFPLCYTVASICTIRGLGPILLAEPRPNPLLFSIAHAITASIVIPSSYEHWLYHCLPHTQSTRRRRSLSDLSSISCDCPPDYSRLADRIRLGDIINAAAPRRTTRHATTSTPTTTTTPATTPTTTAATADTNEHKEPDMDDGLPGYDNDDDHDGGDE